MTITSAGVATAVGAGMAMVRATADGITSSPVTINVAEPPPPEPVVASVTVSPAEAMIEVGATQQFAAKALTSDGMAVPDAEVTWSSSDEMVATVDADGLATGVGAGAAMITATADSVSGTATLTVAEPPPPEPVVATVTVSPASMMIMVGGMFQFTAVAMTADGMVIEDVDFSWMSDDTEVATVDETGLVTAVAAGTAMITATGNDVTSMPATITVEELPPVVAGVEIVDAMPVMLEIGDTHQLMAVARTSEGTMVAGLTFAWSSDDNEVATVDSTGLVSAVGAGMADITAMTEETTSEPVTVTVAEPPPIVDRVTVTPSSATIEEGETRRFTATAYESDNTVIPDKTFTWSSSNPSVATVSPSSGSATTARGVIAGTTTIEATVDGKSDTARLTVTEPPPVVDRVSVSPSSASIEEGETRRFTATAYESDGTVIPGKTFTWSSSNPSVATVSPSSGSSTTARGVNAGSTTIRASVDGKSDTARLTVTEPPPVVDRVSVSPSSASIEEGETRRFTATAYESDGTVIPGKTFTWSSSNPSVATVSPSSGSSTTARGVNAGSTTIRASVDGKSDTARLTVTEPPPVVDRVSVSPSSASIEEGETRRFTATAYESDGTVIPGKTFTWSSSNPSVATVSPSSGSSTTARGVNAGSTTIRASVDGKSDTARLTVTEPPPVVDRVSVSPSTASIEEGETRQFTATAYESDNTVISGKTFAWTSSTTSVATISPSSGTATTATGVSAGSTTIRASVDGKSDTATLTVTAPPPQLKSRTATISGSSNYPTTAGSVTFEEVAGGKLKLTVTGMNDGGGVQAYLFLYTSSSISWRTGNAVPDGARNFGNVTNDSSFSQTFTPSAGETIDSYSHVILHCALIDMRLGSGSLSN
ncbi:MAG: Ig-like domain-containing protein [Gemmatimonadota bacterium]|nr:Ig-like domain-containing protein [Gemmatimonadota bacterium]